MSRIGRNAPSDPLAMMEARARDRAAARAAARDPATWGVDAEIVLLPTAMDVDLVHDQRARVIAAKRSDPFDLLHAAGGLTDDQHRAARRLFRDWCLRAGVKEGAGQLALEKVDGGASEFVTDAMVDAGRRIAKAFRGDPELNVPGIGPVNAKLLEALVSPMVDEGRIIAWRGVVERVTGEKDRNAQGAMVRQACEALHQVYAEASRKRAGKPKVVAAAA